MNRSKIDENILIACILGKILEKKQIDFGYLMKHSQKFNKFFKKLLLKQRINFVFLPNNAGYEKHFESFLKNWKKIPKDILFHKKAHNLILEVLNYDNNALYMDKIVPEDLLTEDMFISALKTKNDWVRSVVIKNIPKKFANEEFLIKILIETKYHIYNVFEVFVRKMDEEKITVKLCLTAIDETEETKKSEILNLIPLRLRDNKIIKEKINEVFDSKKEKFLKGIMV